MLRVLIATENLGKLKEFQDILQNKVACLTPLDPSLEKKASIHVVEDGQTYFENALKKALGYHQAFRVPVLADDSGLEVEPLGNGPGVFTARFGGVGLSWPERWRFLHGALAPFSQETWRARFRCVLCYYDGVNVPIFFEGTAQGMILPEARGQAGFGYDPVFFSSALRKSFAEASPKEKNQISHRAVAVRSFLDWASHQTA